MAGFCVQSSEASEGHLLLLSVKDMKGWGGFLDEMGLELDKWGVENQDGKYSTWEEKLFKKDFKLTF